METQEERTAWINLPAEDQARRQMGDRPSPYNRDFVPAMTRLIMSHERIGPAFGALNNEIMFKRGALSRAEREMIATVAASAQDCFY